jgi:hypothetical protein
MPPKAAATPTVGPGGTYATHDAYRAAYFQQVEQIVFGTAQTNLNNAHAVVQQHSQRARNPQLYRAILVNDQLVRNELSRVYMMMSVRANISGAVISY